MNKIYTYITDFFLSFWPALLSGLLLFLSFPTIDLYPLAWVSLVPLLVSLYGAEKRQALSSGFIFGIVYFFSTTYWIYHSIHHYGSIPFIPSLVIVLLLCLCLSVYTAVFSLLFSQTIARTNLPALIVAPAFWTTLEFVRSYAFTGFPWSSLGYSQHAFLPMIQIADITGIYGISFLIVSFSGAIADAFLLRRRMEDRPLFSRLPTLSGFAVLAAVLLLSLAYGMARLMDEQPGTTVKVSLIQGNIEQDMKWNPSYQKQVLSVYLDLTRTAVRNDTPHLVIWPETALPFIFMADRKPTEDFLAFQRQMNAYLLFGSILESRPKGDDTSVDRKSTFTNSAVLLTRDGKVSYIYDKIHLVPFGEYVPLRSLLFFIDKLVYGIGDYVPGESHTRAITPFGSFGVHICYEIIFPGLVRKSYPHGGDFIVTVTNDAWFGRTNGPYQHFSMAVFRAVENRKPVVRAANSGISGFIDSRGRIVKTIGLFERTFLSGEIHTNTTLTVYTKYGDIFSYFCILCSLFMIMGSRQWKAPSGG